MWVQFCAASGFYRRNSWRGLSNGAAVQACAPEVQGSEALGVRRVVNTSADDTICVCTDFTFESPIPDSSTPPWSPAPITKISLLHRPKELEHIAALSRTSYHSHPADAFAEAEPWQRFRDYMSGEDQPHETRCGSMRFQFMFGSASMPDRVINSLPTRLRDPLGLPYSEGRLSGMGPDVEGKYNVWFENVSFTVREANDLTNAVVTAGGEVYEAFLR